jgi:hypothetical protein
MGPLIARIKSRVAEPLRAVDAATWVCPMPTIAPPASVAELDEAEAALGFAIPTLLRRLYTEVGTGGFGPKYGLEGVPTVTPVPGTADIVALYERYSEQDPQYPAPAVSFDLATLCAQPSTTPDVTADSVGPSARGRGGPG